MIWSVERDKRAPFFFCVHCRLATQVAGPDASLESNLTEWTFCAYPIHWTNPVETDSFAVLSFNRIYLWGYHQRVMKRCWLGVFRLYEIHLDIGWAEVRLWLSAAWHHFFQEVKAAWMIGAETPIFTKNEPRCFGHWSPPELESWKIWYICHGGNMWYLLRYLTLLRIFMFCLMP